ncbi:MAG: hypothetical protein ACP5J2_06560, partial [Caldisericum sp.]
DLCFFRMAFNGRYTNSTITSPKKQLLISTSFARINLLFFGKIEGENRKPPSKLNTALSILPLKYTKELSIRGTK